MSWPLFSHVYLLKCLHRAHFYLFSRSFLLLNLLLRKDLFTSTSALPHSTHYLALGLVTPGSAPHPIFWWSAALRKASDHGQMRTVVVAKGEDYQMCSLNSCQSRPTPRENLSSLSGSKFLMPCHKNHLAMLPASLQISQAPLDPASKTASS